MVPDQKPGAVVVGGVEGREECGNRAGCGGMAASSNGSSPRDRRDGSLASPKAGWSGRRRRRARSRRATCHPTPRPGPHHARGPWSSTVTAVDGRLRTSSRLAPTIRGSPSTTRDATTSRHTLCTLPSARPGHAPAARRRTPSLPTKGYRAGPMTDVGRRVASPGRRLRPRFEDLAAAGMDMHGEAALVTSYEPDSVLDAGCVPAE